MANKPFPRPDEVGDGTLDLFESGTPGCQPVFNALLIECIVNKTINADLLFLPHGFYAGGSQMVICLSATEM